MPDAVIVAGTAEAGGADCLVPVVEELRRRGSTVHAVAGPRAHHLFRRARVPFDFVADAEAEVVADRTIRAVAPSVVVTGLVGSKSNLDYALIRASHRMGRPVVGVLDSWMNYADRMRPEPGAPISLGLTPDAIAVMDDVALSEMAEEGVPAERCVVTGHPKFDRLAALGRPATRLRDRYGIAPEEAILAFFSHSITEAYPRNQLGYTEADAVAVLFDGLRRIRPESRPFLLFKEHPRAETAGLGRLNPPDRYRLLKNGDADELMLGADVVASMSSTLLVFAAGLGIPVISIQPNLVPGEDRCVLTRRGFLKPVGSAGDFATALHAAIEAASGGRARPVSQWGRPAAGRASALVADLVDRMARGEAR